MDTDPTRALGPRTRDGGRLRAVHDSDPDVPAWPGMTTDPDVAAFMQAVTSPRRSPQAWGFALFVYARNLVRGADAIYEHGRTENVTDDRLEGARKDLDNLDLAVASVQDLELTEVREFVAAFRLAAWRHLHHSVHRHQPVFAEQCDDPDCDILDLSPFARGLLEHLDGLNIRL